MDSPRTQLKRPQYDALVIGSGPNGLAAAIVLARAGRTVAVIEAELVPGGGARTLELTEPGFRHDICSAIHPMGVGSPFFRSLDLSPHGLEWIHPPTPLAHALDSGAVLLERSVEATAAGLGEDGPAYARLMGPLTRDLLPLLEGALAPPSLLPRAPLMMARFGLRAVRSARGLVDSWFKGERARALFAGVAAHSTLPLDEMLTAAVGLMLSACGHAVGWPLARGGSQTISDALISLLRSLGGEVVTGWRVRSLAELPPARAVLFDLIPRHVAQIAGDELPTGFRRRLDGFRHGPGSFKIDWSLDGPIPWKDQGYRRAATVHLGGSFEEIAFAEQAVWKGEHPVRPYVLVAQQSLFDATRAPEGKHTGWAYCHVPHGSTVDMVGAIEGQMERFAPGFRELIRKRSVLPPAALEGHNANHVGGDISGGVMDLWQTFTRPVVRLVPYTTPNPRLYLCSSSTPPGPGVHGMCGFNAAEVVLRRALA